MTGGHTFNAKLLQQKDMLNSYLMEAHIPNEIRRECTEYLMHYQSAAMVFHERTVLQMLSPGLQARVSGATNGALIRKIPIFRAAPDACIAEVMLALKPHLFTPGEMIVRQGNVARDMFVVKMGMVSAFVTTEDGEEKKLATLRAGDFFGEGALINVGSEGRRGASVNAKTYAVVYSLLAETVHEVLLNYPEVRKAMHAVATQRRASTRQQQGGKREREKKGAGAADGAVDGEQDATGSVTASGVAAGAADEAQSATVKVEPPSSTAKEGRRARMSDTTLAGAAAASPPKVVPKCAEL